MASPPQAAEPNPSAFAAPGAKRSATLEWDDFSSNRHPALAYCWSMIFSENRYPLFGIMLYLYDVHVFPSVLAMFGAINQNACFNWFEPEHATRDRGEVLSIRQMIDKVGYVPQCGRPIPPMQLRPLH
jgi:hypothetical protein